MKLLHIKDQNELYVIPRIDGLSISVYSSDIHKQWGDLQKFVEHITKEDFDGIVLSANLGSNNDYWGLEFSMRLRLSYSNIKDRAFKTLFVFAEKPVEEIIKEQIGNKTQPTGTVLLTKGTYVFNSLDLFDLISTSEKNYNLLNKENFKADFLDIIQIKHEGYGHHSLANLFGAIRLAEITGYGEILASNQEILKKSSDLYLKYKIDFKIKESKTFLKKVIPSQGKNVLLIDDKENFGWTDILRKLFKDARFDFVASGENFIERTEVKLFTETDSILKFDLVLLDLRLKDEEDGDNSVNKRADEYSGADLLRTIKNYNQGIQVIVFTASNKAWNLKQLTDLGADGYFVKESPEVSVGDDFSLKNFENFVQLVQMCYEYNFLKHFFQKLKEIEKVLKSKVSAKEVPKDFVNEYLKWIKLGNDNLNKNRNELGLTTSFILYFSVLENLSNRLIDVDTPFKSVKDAQGNQLYNFEFRTQVKKLIYFEESPKGSGSYEKTTKSDFFRNISWQQRILNTFDFLSNYKIDMLRVNRLLKKRHEIIHANVTTGNRIQITKEDVIDLFALITNNIGSIK